MNQVNLKDLIAPEDFKAHWAEGLTDEQYHADRTAIGSSGIRAANRSLKEFHWQLTNSEEKETNEMRFGRIIHLAILEPERFKQMYVIQPIFTGYTKKGEPTTSLNSTDVKLKLERWKASLPNGAIVITEDQLGIITKIAHSISEHPDAMELIKEAKPELTGYYRDPETGLRMKIKPDLTTIGSFVLVTDLKSTVSAEQFRFGGIVFNEANRYDIQLFQYSEGARQITGREVPQTHIIAVEKTGPCESAVYYFEKPDLEKAEQDYRAALRKIRAAIDEGQWPQRQMIMQRIYTPKKFIDLSVNQEEAELIQDGGLT